MGSKQRLYSAVLNVDNILSAIKEISKHKGSMTAGPDKLNIKSIGNEEKILKEVKLRLRKRKKVNSRTIEIDNLDGSTRKISIINLYDRIAQQAVYRQIYKILETNMSKHSYGFRFGINSKIVVSKVANVARMYKDASSIELDFVKCFDNIPLEKALTNMKHLGITDHKLLGVIKHLMWISKEYNGVGLSQGTILGPILANCYLNQLDVFMEENFDLEGRDSNYSQRYNFHKGHWVEWMINNNKIFHIKYFRYADNIIIMCHNPEEQQYINRIIRCFIYDKLDIQINESKSFLRTNNFEVLGFRLIKSWQGKKPNIWIKIKDEKKYIKKLNQFRFNSYEDCVKFLKWIRRVLIYFDICNNLSKFLKAIDWRFYIRSLRGMALKKDIGNNYFFGKDGKNKVSLDIYAIRKATRVSFKEYLVNNFWIKLREMLKEKPFEDEYRVYYYALYTKQKGLDVITKKPLKINHMEIHHVIPRKNGGDNSLGNLILIDKDIHHLIHYGKTNDKKIKKYQSKLLK